MAYGLPVEGEAGPFAGSALLGVRTCLPTDRPDDVAGRLESADEDRAVVVTDEDERIVLGLVDLGRLRSAGGDTTVLDVMELSPSTIRPSVPLSDLDNRTAGVLVTTPQGRLLGRLDPAAVEHHHHDHDHDHDDEPEAEEIEREVHEVLEAVEERFGEEEPDKDELRDLLHERLVDRGRTDEEAEQILTEMEEGSPH